MPEHPNDTDLTPRVPRWLVAILTLSVFAIVERMGFALFREVAGGWQGYPRMAALAVLGYGAYLLFPLGLAAALFGPARAFSALGLDRSILAGLKIGLVGTCVLPLGYAATAAFAPAADPLYEALRGAILPGIAEEFLFRAFLFGFLFRFAGWGFLPAALVGAAIFGAGHLYQGEALLDSAAVFAITALGGLWFAWLYVEWGYNVWVPAAFHVLMNLYWGLFAISETALGPLSANALRVAVILISVAMTVRFARRHGGLRIRGQAWWRGNLGRGRNVDSRASPDPASA